MRKLNKAKKEKPQYSLFDNIKYFFGALWNHDKLALIIPILRIPASVALSVMGIYMPKIVLDSLEKNMSPNDIIIRISLATLVLLLLNYLNNWGNLSVTHHSNKIRMHKFQNDVNHKSMDMDYDVFVSPFGKTASKKANKSLGGTVEHKGMGTFYLTITELFKNILGFISFSAILTTLNPLIIILLIISYSLSFVFSMRFDKWLHKSKDERAEISRKLSYVAYKTRGISIGKDIRIYSMADWIKGMANIFLKDQAKWDKKIAIKRMKLQVFDGLLLFLRDGVAYAYLIYLMLNSDMTIGTFSLYFGTIAGFGEWLSRIVWRSEVLSNANHFLIDYRSFLDLPDKMKKDGISPLPSFNKKQSIKLENVSFSFSEDSPPVLDNINLEIKPGEKLAVVGTNGAGKTTLVKLISGLLYPTVGKVFIDGTDIQELGRDNLYTMFSIVFQDISLIPASIAMNIALCTKEDIDYDRVWQCIEYAGLTDKVNSLANGIESELMKNIVENGTELSGGETQKLLLARALYKNAPILILDEPTAALDPIAENEMYLKYDAFAKGRTSIYISHRLSSTKFCNRIAFIEGADIVEIGTHEELMALGGKYAEMFSIQSQYYRDDEEVAM